MPRESGKYRYRLAIQKYNGTAWIAYGNAWATVEVISTELSNEEEKTKGQRAYEVKTPYNPSLTIGTTGFRFSWSVQGATRLLYIHGVDTDEKTFLEESIFTCMETVR